MNAKAPEAEMARGCADATVQGVKGLACFFCGHALPEHVSRFKDDVWIAACPICGVVNKLIPADAGATRFLVGGGFFNLRG